MGFVKGSPKACLFIGFLFLLNCVFAQEISKEEKKVYVVYLGAKQHDDPKLVSESHHKMLESVLGSAEAARESIIYNYQHGFSGFAARLTESQAKKLSGLLVKKDLYTSSDTSSVLFHDICPDRPDVFSVASNRKLQMQSTRMFDYLGLSPVLPKGILQESDMGSDKVIGILDSGLWPESEAFNDKGLGPIPKHWKGECVAGPRFDPAKHCNKKLIGAKYFLDSWEEKHKGTKISQNEIMSPRGGLSHGTIVSSIAASAFLPNVSYKGLAPGVMRGGAPKARIAMYKVLWETQPFGSGIADCIRAFDEAIKDGVDVISVSLGPSGPPYRPLNAVGEDLEIGSFHAVMKGIPVVTAAGNSGPDAYTVVNVAPWMITVGATSLDRSYSVDMTFGNNITIMGQALYPGDGLSADLVYIEDWKTYTATSDLRGKVYLTFAKEDWDWTSASTSLDGAVGAIVARPSDALSEGDYTQPRIAVDYEVGTKILQYIRSSRSPTVKISRGKTLVGRPIATTVAGFSCRGPNSAAPGILKPDLVAPGMNVLGADIIVDPQYSPGFAIVQGTSFAAPAVTGIVALLRSLHPDWSPAALKSAMMTTAWKTDPHGDPIFAEGSPRKLADPFDYGAGLVNAERAKDPGLVYDMNIDDYIHFLCASSYNETAISVLTGKPTKCSSPLPSILDVNYPAITIPELKDEVNITRTVTNVGPVDSVYRAVVEAPEGVKIVVEPQTLVFSSSTKKLGFKVRVSTSHKSNTGYFFGSFTWTDGTRNVTIPLSVRTRV
uniref:Putative transcription factor DYSFUNCTIONAL TAPETUM 1 n=1 Tax=Sisymbrium irio TaxID=3730 RepID=R9S9I7_SISIR|nr:putative transcription factor DYSFUNCTIONAL TAPETUM 1 [Sisymbrium irio]